MGTVLLLTDKGGKSVTSIFLGKNESDPEVALFL